MIQHRIYSFLHYSEKSAHLYFPVLGIGKFPTLQCSQFSGNNTIFTENRLPGAPSIYFFLNRDAIPDGIFYDIRFFLLI